MDSFISKVRTLQRDDHRYDHQCRINQTLHLVSAISFVVAYLLLLRDPAAAGLVGWLVGMVTRQSGHIISELRGQGRPYSCVGVLDAQLGEGRRDRADAQALQPDLSLQANRIGRHA